MTDVQHCLHKKFRNITYTQHV